MRSTIVGSILKTVFRRDLIGSDEIMMFAGEKDHPHFWKCVHTTESTRVFMLNDCHAVMTSFNRVNEAIEDTFIFNDPYSVFTIDDIVPNNGRYLWLPSVKQLGFTPVNLNGILHESKFDNILTQETFEYFADPETVVDRRKEFGKRYWTSTPCVCNPYSAWFVNSRGSIYAGTEIYDTCEVRPCIEITMPRD